MKLFKLNTTSTEQVLIVDHIVSFYKKRKHYFDPYHKFDPDPAICIVTAGQEFDMTYRSEADRDKDYDMILKLLEE